MTRARVRGQEPGRTRAQFRMHVTHDTNTEHDFPARGIHKGLTPPTSDIHTHMPGTVTVGARHRARAVYIYRRTDLGDHLPACRSPVPCQGNIDIYVYIYI